MNVNKEPWTGVTMSFRPRNPLGDNNGAVASQSQQILPPLGGGSIQAKRFGATPRKALGDLGNISNAPGGFKDNAKKPKTLLVVGPGPSGGGLKERSAPLVSHSKSQRSRMLEAELAGGLREWGDDDSGDDDLDIENMHLPPVGGRHGYDQPPWPKGKGPADGVSLDSLLCPWPGDLHVRRGAEVDDTSALISIVDDRTPQHDLDALLDHEPCGFADDLGIEADITVDIPFDDLSVA